MRIFTREEMNHEDIDRAFQAHQPKNKKYIKSDKSNKIQTTQTLSAPDNFLIMIILVLLLLEMKEK